MDGSFIPHYFHHFPFKTLNKNYGVFQQIVSPPQELDIHIIRKTYTKSTLMAILAA